MEAILGMGITDITISSNLGLLAVLNLLGAAQGVLLALALLTTKGGNEIANRLLAALTLTISIVVIGAVLLTSNYVFVFPHLSRTHQPFVFLAAPLLFLYIRELTSRERKFAKKDYLHFIPFVVCLIYLLPYFSKQDREDQNPNFGIHSGIIRTVVLHSIRGVYCPGTGLPGSHRFDHHQVCSKS